MTRKNETAARVRKCRKCNCTTDDCRGCIKRTGGPCSWVERDLCSACVPHPINVLQDGFTVILPHPDDDNHGLFCGRGPGDQVQLFDNEAEATRLRDEVRKKVHKLAHVVKVTYTVRSDGVPL